MEMFNGVRSSEINVKLIIGNFPPGDSLRSLRPRNVESTEPNMLWDIKLRPNLLEDLVCLIKVLISEVMFWHEEQAQ